MCTVVCEAMSLRLDSGEIVSLWEYTSPCRKGLLCSSYVSACVSHGNCSRYVSFYPLEVSFSILVYLEMFQK